MVSISKLGSMSSILINTCQGVANQSVMCFVCLLRNSQKEKNPMALSCAWTTVCRPLDTEKSLCYTHNERCCWSWKTRRRNFGNKIIVLYANRQLLLTLTVDAAGQKWCDEKLKKRALLWPFKSTATVVPFGIQESAKMIMKKYKI